MINIIIYHQYHITIMYYHKLSHFHEHFHLAQEGRQEGKLCDPHWFLEIMRKIIFLKLFSKYRLSFRRAMSFDILSPSRGFVRCNGRHFEESEPSSSSKPKSWWGNTSLTWMYLQLAALVRITQPVQYCVALVFCRDKGKHVMSCLLTSLSAVQICFGSCQKFKHALLCCLRYFCLCLVKKSQYDL